MLFELGIAAGIVYLGYRGALKKRSCIRQDALSALPITRAEQSGALGEERTDAKLRDTLDWLCGSNYYLHRSLVIEHAPGSAFPTAEIDHLAVTPFGIFVFETKNWTGDVSAAHASGQLLRIAPDGTRETRKSPIAQNRSKITFLKRHLPPLWPVHGAGVFTGDHVTLSADLPLDLMRLDDLSQWLRSRRDSYSDRTPVDVKLATKAVLMYSDRAPDALRRHQDSVKRSYVRL